jgi:co-chaperonin GroES (HSP10)
MSDPLTSKLPVAPHHLRLLNGKVLVRVDGQQQKFGAILIPTGTKMHPPSTGVVVATSTSYSYTDQRHRRHVRPVVVKVGDRVSFPPHDGTQWERHGVQYRMYHATELQMLLGVPEESTA